MLCLKNRSWWMPIKIISFCWFGMVAVPAAYSGKFAHKEQIPWQICMDSGASIANDFCSGQCCVHVHFSFRYSVVFYSGIRWCPQYIAWRFQAKTWNELPWWISIFLQIKKGNTSFGISHKYLFFPTLALSKSGSRVEGNTFLSACFQAPLHTYSVPIKV